MAKLLIVTQKIDENDDVLSFFQEWIRSFAGKWEKIYVICLKLGKYNLPSNVKVLSLGKEKKQNKLGYLIKFYRYIWRLRKEYDSVFVHMNPLYVPLGWPVWGVTKKKISLWYAHGHVPFMLKIANYFTDIAFASTKEGYRLKSEKLKIVGQGIDTNKFLPADSKRNDGKFKIVTIGRISVSKDYETLINAVKELPEKHNFSVSIVGGVSYERENLYLDSLKNKVRESGLENIIRFIGPVPNKDIVEILQGADLFVNMSHTGSLDKANLEAMSCGLPLITCNEAFGPILGHYRGRMTYPKKDHLALAEKIKWAMNLDAESRSRISSDLRNIVVRDHNLESLITKISSILNEFKK